MDWTRFDHRHEEHAQRFNTLLEEVRADWKQMDRFIQASTENIQTLFAEVFSYLAAIGGVDKNCIELTIRQKSSGQGSSFAGLMG